MATEEMGEPLLTLTPRERALLTPAFAAIEQAQQVIGRAQDEISRLVRMRAQRDDVWMDAATGHVYAAPQQQPVRDASEVAAELSAALGQVRDADERLDALTAARAAVGGGQAQGRLADT